MLTESRVAPSGLPGRTIACSITSRTLARVHRATGAVADTFTETTRRLSHRQPPRGLRTLGDHLLKDIGCHRSEIPGVVRRAEAAPNRRSPSC